MGRRRQPVHGQRRRHAARARNRPKGVVNFQPHRTPLSRTCAWTLRSDSTTSPSKATSQQSGQQARDDHDPRYRQDATSASPAAVRSGKQGGQWKITQYMYQQMPEQSGGVAPTSCESATPIRTCSASACGRLARRGVGHVDLPARTGAVQVDTGVVPLRPCACSRGGRCCWQSRLPPITACGQRECRACHLTKLLSLCGG
jgi:hypothetical protein